FCSAKLDCCDDADANGCASDGSEDLRLLFDGSGQRARTVVLGFACTAGVGGGVATDLWMNALELDCDVTTDATAFGADLRLDPSAGPGNLCAAGDVAHCAAVTVADGVTASAFLYQAALYRGQEDLQSAGAPAQKVYWNVALGVGADIGHCTLRTRGTAVDAGAAAPLAQNGTIPGGVVYPYVSWDVDLGSCGAEKLTFGDPGAPVAARYTGTGGGATSFGYHYGVGVPAGPFCSPACQHGGACVDGHCDCSGTSYDGETCENPNDLIPPDPPQILSQASSSVATNGDSLLLAGTCEPGATLSVTGDLGGATSCDGSGAFSLTLTATADGTYDVALRAADAVGNVSAPTAFRWVRDTAAPAPPALTPPAGTVYDGGDALAVAGTCEDGGDVVVSGAIDTTVACSGGAFSLALTATTDGARTYDLRARDAVGNASAAATLVWVRDTTTPATPALLAPAATPWDGSEQTLAVTVGCTDGHTVHVTGDASADLPCDAGAATLLADPGADGTFTYVFTQEAPLTHNLSDALTVTWRRDTVAPGPVVVTTPAASPTATRGDALDLLGDCEDGALVGLSGAGDAATTCAGGRFALTLTATTDGDHDAVLVQGDAAGNVSEATVFRWTRDTTAPAAPALTAPGASPTYHGAATLDVAGTCEDGATVVIDGAESGSVPCVGGAFAATLTSAGDGVYDYTFAVVDGVGNASAATALQWVRDNTLPDAPTITSHSSPFDGNASPLALAGACTDGDLVRLGGAEVQSTPCSGGTFAFTLSQAEDGVWSYELRQEHPLTHNLSDPTPFQWNLDTDAPDAPTVTAPGPSPFSSGYDNLLLGGDCETGATVALDGEEHALIPCETGAWSYQVTRSTNGVYVFTVAQADAAGNVSASVGFEWTRDDTVPAAPTLVSPAATPHRTNGDALTVVGTCEGVNAVHMTGAESGDATCAGGQFGFALAATSDGARGYAFTQVSAVNGFVSAPLALDWVRDTAAPAAPTVETPATDPYFSGESSFLLGGACEAGATVALTLGGAPAGSAVCAGDGTFVVSLGASSDGTYAYDLAQTDVAGNASGATSFTWVRDTSIPGAPAVVSPATSPHHGATSPLGLTVSCEAGDTVYLQGADTQTLDCGGDGEVLFQLAEDVDGSYAYTLVQENPNNGRQSSVATFTWVFDTTPPDEVTVTSPPQNPYFSGDDTITIAGDCETGALVAMTGSSTQSATCAAGAYAFQVTKLSNTTYNFNLTQTDKAGNTSLTKLFQWVRDNTIPATPVITSPATPYFSSGSSVTLSGTCQPDFTLTLGGAATQSATCSAGGTFSLVVAAATDATRVYSLKQVNPNTLLESSETSFSWTRDTAAPAAPVIRAPSSNPYTSGDTLFTLSGDCETGATVTLSGAQSGTFTCAASAFRFDLSKSQNGTYDYALAQKDKANNTSPTTTFRWVRDTSVPATPVISSPNPNPTTTNTSSLTIAGSCAGANTVTLSLAGSPVATTTCAGGAFSFAQSKSSDGTYAYAVKQTSASSIDSASVAVTWTRDTSPPAAPTLTAVTPTSPGASTTPKLTGTVPADAVTVQIYKSAACTGGVAATGTPANFTGGGVAVSVSPGATSLSVKVLDLAGNASPCSATSLSYTQRAATLVKDINADGTGSSSPSYFGVVGSKVYFRATDGVVGYELWASDGTAAGTYMVKDINPADSGYPAYMTDFGGIAYFYADDGEHGAELWRSDGTEDGTWMVADINEGPFPSAPANFKVVGGTLYFTADDGDHGVELWKTDGTEAGTVLVKDIEAGALSSSPNNLTAFGSKLVFRATTAANGLEMYATTGTAAGTTMYEIDAGVESSNPAYFTLWNGAVYFQGTDTDSDNNVGAELFKFDGSAVSLVRNLYGTTSSGGPAYLLPMGNRLYFYARVSSTISYELYYITTTDTAPVLVKDIEPTASTGGVPVYLTAINTTKFVFRALTIAEGYEPWVSDGTELGTFILKDTNPGALDSGMSAPVATNGKAFWAGTTDGDVELWETDGTKAGTIQRNLNPGLQSSSPGTLTVFGNKLVFAATTAADGREPWIYDASGPHLLKDLNTQPSSTPGSFVQLGSSVLFAADDGAHGRELWKTDGTAGNTALLKDINTAVAGASSNPTGFVVLGSYAYFRADDGSHGNELWRTDGTASGTVLVTDVCPGSDPSTPNYLTVLGSYVYFAATDCGTNGNELWRVTGTGGVTLAKNIFATATKSSNPVGLVAMGTKLYFRANDGATGNELYSWDPATSTLANIANMRGGSSSNPANLTVVGGNKLFFTTNETLANPGYTGVELYYTNGTAGNYALMDIYPGTVSSSPGNLRDLNGTLVCAATSPTTGRELFKVTFSGSTPTASVVRDIRAGATSATPGPGLVL
ncbi:MAG: hypothetical protein KC635_00165, partial [Myxococcales bacterium]|nr:hypothetical protein [Myxococcales bacterium]